MRRFTFAALVGVGVARGAGAQTVPGRELLEFPIATVAEPQALAVRVAGGLWNPALLYTRPGDRVLASVAALNTPIAQGVSAQYLAGTFLLRPNLFGALSLTRAQVSDLLRTEDNPSSVNGAEIPYNTTILSAAVARRSRHNSVGLALRWRTGTADVTTASAFSVDAGVRLDSLFRTGLRVGASTFLFSPGRTDDEPLGLVAAAELPVTQNPIREVDLGYSYSYTQRYGQEHYLYTAARWKRLDGRVGVAQYEGFATTTRRLRLGVGLQYARYLIGLSREESGGGIGASYQFTLTSSFK